MTPARFETVEELFHDALARPEAERSEFIRRRANGDEALAAEVSSLLAAHAETTFVKGDTDRTDWIGKRVGDYRIQREIGRGGMGAIYLAIRDDDAFRKAVAVKVIKRGMDSDAIIRRFRNERQILADLDHPNVARLLDGGTTDDGLPFFVMEYIDGRTLDDFCRGLDVEARVRLFVKVCEAVGYAHSRGVVHRDLKPSNILITKSGEPKLLDFGIAKVFDTDSIEVTAQMTAAGQQVLTPAYASPEQLRGESATPRSDVYSLGVILYEALTGNRPQQSNPHPPSTITGHRSLRGDVDNIVMTALDPEPLRRYADATELARDLTAHLQGEPVRARRQTAVDRVRRLVRPYATRVTVVTVIVAAVSGYVVSRRERPPAPPSAADVTMKRLTAYGDIVTAAISGDAKTLAFARRSGERQDLWIHDLIADADRVVERNKFFSQLAVTHDGSRVFYSDATGIWMKSSHDGNASQIVVKNIISDFAITPQGDRIAFLRLQGDRRVALAVAGSGDERVIWRSNPGDSVGAPSWAPNGREVYISVDDAKMQSSIWNVNVGSGATRLMTPTPIERVISMAALADGSGAVISTEKQGDLPKVWFLRWSDAALTRIAGDFSVYRGVSVTAASDAFVMTRHSAPSNIYSLDLSKPDEKVALTAGENYFGRSGVGYLPDGTVLFNSISEGDPALLLLSKDSTRPRALPVGMPARMPRVNAATRRIGYLSNRSGIEEVWTCNFDGSDARQITKHGTVAQFDFMPDGSAIVYATRAERGIFIAPTDGKPRRKLSDRTIIRHTIVNNPGGWLSVSPDGQLLVCDVTEPGPDRLITKRAVLRVSDGSLVRVLDPALAGNLRQWLPDGSGVAGISQLTNVIVQKLDGGKPYTITNLKGRELRMFAFAPDGKSLLLSWGEPSRDAVMFKNFR